MHRIGPGMTEAIMCLIYNVVWIYASGHARNNEVDLYTAEDPDLYATVIFTELQDVSGIIITDMVNSLNWTPSPQTKKRYKPASGHVI